LFLFVFINSKRAPVADPNTHLMFIAEGAIKGGKSRRSSVRPAVPKKPSVLTGMNLEKSVAISRLSSINGVAEVMKKSSVSEIYRCSDSVSVSSNEDIKLEGKKGMRNENIRATPDDMVSDSNTVAAVNTSVSELVRRNESTYGASDDKTKTKFEKKSKHQEDRMEISNQTVDENNDTIFKTSSVSEIVRLREMILNKEDDKVKAHVEITNVAGNKNILSIGTDGSDIRTDDSKAGTMKNDSTSDIARRNNFVLMMETTDKIKTNLATETNIARESNGTSRGNGIDDSDMTDKIKHANLKSGSTSKIGSSNEVVLGDSNNQLKSKFEKKSKFLENVTDNIHNSAGENMTESLKITSVSEIVRRNEVVIGSSEDKMKSKFDKQSKFLGNGKNQTSNSLNDKQAAINKIASNSKIVSRSEAAMGESEDKIKPNNTVEASILSNRNEKFLDNKNDINNRGDENKAIILKVKPLQELNCSNNKDEDVEWMTNSRGSNSTSTLKSETKSSRTIKNENGIGEVISESVSCVEAETSGELVGTMRIGRIISSYEESTSTKGPEGMNELLQKIISASTTVTEETNSAHDIKAIRSREMNKAINSGDDNCEVMKSMTHGEDRDFESMKEQNPHSISKTGQKTNKLTGAVESQNVEFELQNCVELDTRIGGESHIDLFALNGKQSFDADQITVPTIVNPSTFKDVQTDQFFPFCDRRHTPRQRLEVKLQPTNNCEVLLVNKSADFSADQAYQTEDHENISVNINTDSSDLATRSGEPMISSDCQKNGSVDQTVFSLDHMNNSIDLSPTSLDQSLTLGGDQSVNLAYQTVTSEDQSTPSENQLATSLGDQSLKSVDHCTEPSVNSVNDSVISVDQLVNSVDQSAIVLEQSVNSLNQSAALSSEHIPLVEQSDTFVTLPEHPTATVNQVGRPNKLSEDANVSEKEQDPLNEAKTSDVELNNVTSSNKSTDLSVKCDSLENRLKRPVGVTAMDETEIKVKSDDQKDIGKQQFKDPRDMACELAINLVDSEDYSIEHKDQLEYNRNAQLLDNSTMLQEDLSAVHGKDSVVTDSVGTESSYDFLHGDGAERIDMTEAVLTEMRNVMSDKLVKLQELANVWKTEVVGCDGEFVRLKELIHCSSEPIEAILSSLNVSVTY